ncbi:MAG: LLM class flavin-dependent oxidoreductase [Candidatus Rokuibacteriota bacterium]|nr:MAG: LLM class flavin-dependent oxidoreductase [Candidatus Rokubacteria bacterium]
MDFGINLATAADSWKVVKRAEELGYARAWFYDTQLLNADLFVAMGAAAVQTSRIRLATGVLIPSNRIAPVAASALASLNALAPGRIDFGVSTGFTARRTMGLGPVRLDDLREYIRVVRGLLAGDTLEWTFEGQRRKIRFLSPELGVVNVTDPIPLHISALGPRGRRLTAELAAGWICATGHVGSARAAVADMQAAWRAVGIEPATRPATAFTGGCVLKDGEACDGPRARAQAGPHATIALHNLVEAEQFGDMGRGLPPSLAPLLERYREIYLKYEPPDARYLANHRGHLMVLRPEEQEVCTAELIRTVTFTATRPELQERIRELGRAGYNHFAISIRHGHPQMLEEWADVFGGV